MRINVNWDVGLGLCFAAIGGFLFGRGWMMPQGTSGVPGPGFFPLLVGGLLLALGFGLAVQGLRNDRTYWSRGWWDPAMGRIFEIVAISVLYLLFWEELHFLLATTALLLIIYLILEVVWWRALALAVGFTVTLYGVFQWLFNIRF
jgi:hypothetical protein